MQASSKSIQKVIEMMNGMFANGTDEMHKEEAIDAAPIQKVMEMMNGMLANGDDEKHKEEVGFGKEGKEFGSRVNSTFLDLL